MLCYRGVRVSAECLIKDHPGGATFKTEECATSRTTVEVEVVHNLRNIIRENATHGTIPK